MIGDLVRVRYEIVEELSSSAIFDNYVARDRVRNTEVCLRMVKQPFASEVDFVQALGQVVEKTRALDHPNIARVYEIDEHDGRPFIVCELIRGAALGDRIRRLAPFSPSVACELTIGICDGLEHAAGLGIAHGDLCADHVITTLEGRVAVIDFGLWESYGASRSAGAIVLSRMAPYLAPEIIEGEMPSFSSDVYAVGVILFELLTGLLPFSGLTSAAIIAKHATQPVPSARAMNPAIPQVLDEIIQKALAKKKEDRYSSAAALGSDLRKLLDALRFGKRMDWPLGMDDTGAPRPPAAQTYAEKKREKRLGAVIHQQTHKRADERVLRAGSSRRIPLAAEPEPDDVPWPLRAAVWLLAGVVCALVIVWVYFNLTQKPEVEAPNLIGLSLTEARQRAQERGLELVNAGEEYNERYPSPKTVFWMDPAPKTPMRQGGTIQVKISAGSRMVEVPDVRGLSVAEARVRLEGLSLQIDPTIRREANKSIDEGMIIRTDPGPFEKVERGSAITLIVSSGRKAPDRPSADASDLIRNTWSLSFRVIESEEPVLVRVEMTDARGTALTIFEEERPGGDTIELADIQGYGKTATFRVYFNNNLEMTFPNRKGVEQ